MVISMTGFGRGRSQSEKYTVTVEIKTVNHRFLEFNIRIPRQLIKMEDKIKKTIAPQLSRGRVEVFVTIDGQGIYSQKVNVNWELLDEYYKVVTKIQEKYHLRNDITVSDLLELDDIISIDEKDTGTEELEALILEATEIAATALKQMRQTEGDALAKDVTGHLRNFRNKLQKVRDFAPLVVQQYAERLRKRMEEFAEGELDEARIVNEVAIFADKADISEELARLSSHIEQFGRSMKVDESIGRKLDFYLQEMNREVNTIGSKANDASIALEVVEMKSLLEKMKEQVQNIE